MDQTTPLSPRPVAQARRRRPSRAPMLAFWAAVLMLVGARVALFDGIRPGPVATGTVVLAGR